MHDDDGSNVVDFFKPVGEKKIVHLTFTDVDIDKLKKFMEEVGQDDYEIRQDALGAAISFYHQTDMGTPMSDIVETAENFYAFLKGGDDGDGTATAE